MLPLVTGIVMNFEEILLLLNLTIEFLLQSSRLTGLVIELSNLLVADAMTGIEALRLMESHMFVERVERVLRYIDDDAKYT